VCTVGLTTVIGLSLLVGALVLGLSLDSKHAGLWAASTLVLLLAQFIIAEPLKLLALALYASRYRHNVPQ